VKAVRAAGVLAAVAGLGCLAQAGWIHLKAHLAQTLIARAWERCEHGERDARPWPWADTQPIAKLMLPGYPARALFVLEGSSARNLAFGPAHDAASVLPGEPGNSVIAGHRDTAFRVLESLHVGDRLQVERAGRRHWFEVHDVRIVDSRRTRLALTEERPRLTLVTCYPFASLEYGGPLRWVVTADLLDAAPPPPPRH
jgi:sortase A